jgi:CDP-diacylglycerol--glycerol-3-phosphate 3-phosphatidyltransferase
MQIKVKEFFYLPNLLTLSRIFLMWPLVWLLKNSTPSNFWLLLALSVIAASTDALDGFLSRKMGLVTDLGIVLDPLADKICMAIAFIALIIYRHFPIPLIIFLIYRDVMIILIGWYVLKKTGKPIMPNVFGKANTTIIAFIGLLFLFQPSKPIINPFLILGYLSVLISGGSYAFLGLRLLGIKGYLTILYWTVLALLSVLVILLTVHLQFLM